MTGTIDRVALVITPAVDDVAALLAAGDRACGTDGDLQASRYWYERAYQVAEADADPHGMAAAALGLGGLWVHEHRAPGASAALEVRLRQALSLVERGSALGIRLRTRLAAEADYRACTHDTVLALLDEARQAPDPVIRAEALSLAHHCVLGPEHARLRADLARELVETSVLTGRRGDLLMGLLWQTVDQLLAGRPHARRHLAGLRGLLAERQHLAVGFVVDAIAVLLAIRDGGLAEAERLAETCVAQGTAAGDVDATGWYGAQLVAIRWYQGRLPELLPMLTELVHSPTLSVVDNSYFAALAVAAAQAGQRRDAQAALAALRGPGLAELPRSSSWLVTMFGAVEAAFLLDDAGTAAQAYELLAPFGHLPAVASLGVACFGSTEHALGLAALTVGDLDRAVTHLAAAVDANLSLGHAPAAVWSRLRYAQALQRRGTASDLATARTQLSMVAADAAALGLPLPADTVPATAPNATCAREGRRWRVTLGGRSAVVEHSVGMLHLAVLLANPGTDIPAVDLVAGVSGLAAETAERQELGAPRSRGAASAQAMLDRTAVAEYRRRLTALRETIDDPYASPARVAEARAEQDWLMAELNAATGLGGRARAFPDGSERARLAVGKAIRRAITRIIEADATIGEHLRLTVHTGTRCSYHGLSTR